MNVAQIDHMDMVPNTATLSLLCVGVAAWAGLVRWLSAPFAILILTWIAYDLCDIKGHDTSSETFRLLSVWYENRVLKWGRLDLFISRKLIWRPHTLLKALLLGYRQDKNFFY